MRPLRKITALLHNITFPKSKKELLFRLTGGRCVDICPMGKKSPEFVGQGYVLKQLLFPDSADQLSHTGPICLTELAYVCCGWSFLPLHDVEFNPLAFRQRPEALPLNSGMVDKNIRALFLSDKPETL
jgi:hypothetical protein